MKDRFFARALLAVVGIALLVLLPKKLAAQDASRGNAPGAAPSRQSAAVQLSPGAAEILKLAQAQVGEETISAFIATSGRTYPLRADEIIYLRKQGVSDGVLTAMLNQQSKVTPVAPVAAPPPQTAPPAQPGSYPPVSTAACAQVAPLDTAPATVYLAASPPTYIYYSYPYYYGGCWPYWYPAVSLSFGYGGCYYGGRYYGYGCAWRGYRGTGYHPGGYWGGGFHGAPAPGSGFHGARATGGGFHATGFSGGGVRIASAGGGGFHGGGFSKGRR